MCCLMSSNKLIFTYKVSIKVHSVKSLLRPLVNLFSGVFLCNTITSNFFGYANSSVFKNLKVKEHVYKHMK